MGFDHINNNLDLSDDKYYYYCCASLGDTMITLSLKDELEYKLNSKIIFILKNTHEIIAKMYDIRDYILLNTIEMKEKIEGMLSLDPKKGSIYAAHPCLHPELAEFFEPIKSHTSTRKFLSWICNFFGLEISHKVKSPLFYPSITDELMDKLLCIGPLNKIVLISPEAISMPALPENFWIRLVKDIRCRDLIPVSNVIDVNNSIKGSLYVKLDINEALRLGLYCKEVHSIRSGFCDLLFSRNKDLHVYYPIEESYYIYSMNDMFERADIDECVVIE